MQIKENVSLKDFNTFGFDVQHKGLIEITTEDDIIQVIKSPYRPLKIIGGGSNILLTQDVDAYVLHNGIKGIHIEKEDHTCVHVRVGGGESWHEFVLWTLEHNYGGLENLALIPGSVGAAPMQNIGAYGVEQNICFDYLEAIHLSSGEKHIFHSQACAFGYRESVFKMQLKDQFFITHVIYRLHKPPHTLHLSYGAITDVLRSRNIIEPTIQDVAQAVIEIRQSKLPNPKEIGNAGSFFKNPVIDMAHFLTLEEQYPNMPNYPVSDTEVKVPAGWLIEQCGFKGTIYGNVGVHKHQALVLVHIGNGHGSQILGLAQKIQTSVKEKFDINIHAEVNIW